MRSPPYDTSPDLLVLHTLRCIGAAGVPRVAEAAGLPEADTESELIDLGVAGLVTHASAGFGGWRLTDAGRAADAQRIAAELDASGARAVVADAYERFLRLNPELLEVCTAWQVRFVDGVMTPNDHGDAAYDADVLRRLADVDRRSEGVLVDLAEVLRRFGRYRVRLTDALERARSGELDRVTDDLSSYHTVWFQLHEDLLATQGLDRG